MTKLPALFDDYAASLFCPGCEECDRARAAMEAWCSGPMVPAPYVETDPRTGHTHLVRETRCPSP